MRQKTMQVSTTRRIEFVCTLVDTIGSGIAGGAGAKLLST